MHVYICICSTVLIFNMAFFKFFCIKFFISKTNKTKTLKVGNFNTKFCAIQKDLIGIFQRIIPENYIIKLYAVKVIIKTQK